MINEDQTGFIAQNICGKLLPRRDLQALSYWILTSCQSHRVTLERLEVEGIDAQALPNVVSTFFTRFETHDFSSEFADVIQSQFQDSTTFTDQAIVFK